MKSARSRNFPTTRHLIFLVAYSSMLCALLAPLGRRHNAIDFYLLSTLLILGSSRLVSLVIWRVERPDERRERHLLLGVMLGRLSEAVVAAGACAAAWAYDWSDFHFFMRVEGRHWLLFWLAIPIWSIASGRLLSAGGNGRLTAPDSCNSRRRASC